MASNKIKFTTNESCNYVVLQYEGFQKQGECITYSDLLALIKYLGYQIEYKIIPDIEMEGLR